MCACFGMKGGGAWAGASLSGGARVKEDSPHSFLSNNIMEGQRGTRCLSYIVLQT